MSPAHPPDYPHAVTARLWEPIQPIDRGDRYEERLGAALQERNIGALDGGGSELSPDGEIRFVEIEMRLTDLDGGVEIARALLEECGAPKASELRFSRDGSQQIIEFGVAECLALYLDGTSLPDDVYAESDVNELIAQIESALGPHNGQFRSYWEGPAETALYFFGPDAEVLLQAAQPILESYPLCRNARVIVRHGNPKLESRSLRQPR